VGDPDPFPFKQQVVEESDGVFIDNEDEDDSEDDEDSEEDPEED